MVPVSCKCNFFGFLVRGYRGLLGLGFGIRDCSFVVDVFGCEKLEVFLFRVDGFQTVKGVVFNECNVILVPAALGVVVELLCVVRKFELRRAELKKFFG